MTGSQIKKLLTEIIDSMVEERMDSLSAEIGQEELENTTYDRDEAIDQLIKMIEFYRKDL